MAKEKKEKLSDKLKTAKTREEKNKMKSTEIKAKTKLGKYTYNG